MPGAEGITVIALTGRLLGFQMGICLSLGIKAHLIQSVPINGRTTEEGVKCYYVLGSKKKN